IIERQHSFYYQNLVKKFGIYNQKIGQTRFVGMQVKFMRKQKDFYMMLIMTMKSSTQIGWTYFYMGHARPNGPKMCHLKMTLMKHLSNKRNELKLFLKGNMIMPHQKCVT